MQDALIVDKASDVTFAFCTALLRRLRFVIGGLSLATGFVLALPGSFALAEEVNCRISPGNAKYYIASEIFISYDEYGDARVMDSIIAATGRKAVSGSVTLDTKKLLRITWQLQNVAPDPLESQRFRDPSLLMRLSITRSDGSAQLSVVDTTNRNFTYRAVGKCRVDK